MIGKTVRLGYRRSTAKLSRAIDQPRANRPDIASLHVTGANETQLAD
jgi:hypothetical protein